MMWRVQTTLARRARLELVPIQPDRLALAGVAAVVRHVSLAGDQIELAVAVHVGEHRRVRLRPRVVDDALGPAAVGVLLEPADAVVVRPCR